MWHSKVNNDLFKYYEWVILLCFLIIKTEGFSLAKNYCAGILTHQACLSTVFLILFKTSITFSFGLML